MKLKQQTSSSNSVIVIICLMSVMSQFATDSFTPSLPHITASFPDPYQFIKALVGIYFFGMGSSAILFGYLSDKYGRKKVLISSYILFLIASSLCWMSQNIWQLIQWRLLQGIAMGCTLISIKAIIKDTFNGGELMKANLTVSGVATLTPPLAPVTGGYIQEYFGWRYNFSLHAAMAIGMIIIILFFLHIENEKKSDLRMFACCKNICANQLFMLHAVCGGLALSIVFIFITHAPFLLQNVYQLSSVQYAFAMAFTIVPSALLAILSRPYIRKISTRNLMIYSAIVSFIGAALMSASYFIFSMHLLPLIITCAIISSGNVFQHAASYAGAYQTITSHTGIASAIYGIVQVMTTACISLLFSRVQVENQMILGALMAIPPILIWLLSMTKIKPILQTESY